MELKRVVVTGLGALTPIGNNVSEYWEALVAGKSGCANITYFDTEKFKTKFACELKNFNPPIPAPQITPTLNLSSWSKLKFASAIASSEETSAY